MPPKAKKKRASLTLDSGQIKEAEEVSAGLPAGRQVVEVVEEEGSAPEAIEEVVESISPESKASVDSLFVQSDSGVTPEITVVSKRGPSLGVWVGAMLGVALAIGVALILLVRGPSTLPFLAVKPTPTPSPTIEPTPVPVTVQRSDIKVSVLNGGGTPGAGSKMKTFLEEKGYTVVSVGNTEEYTYEQTEVLIASGKDEYATLLREDLKAEYTLGTSSATVAQDADFDAQVIVGKEE